MAEGLPPSSDGEEQAVQVVAAAAREAGWGPGAELVITVAQMLAVIATPEPKLRDARRLLLEPASELPSLAWSHILDAMVVADERLQPHRGRFHYPPGLIDRIRRPLLDLQFARSGEAAPAALVQAVFHLASGRHGDMPQLSPASQILVAEGLAIQPGERVLCVGAGTAALALLLASKWQARVRLVVPDEQVASLCTWLALASRAEVDVWIEHPRAWPVFLGAGHASLGSDFDDFDAAILDPPLGPPRGELVGTDLLRMGVPPGSSPESLHVALAARRARRAACFVPAAYLFRTTRAEQLAKEAAIVRHGLDAVVALPRGALGSQVALSLSLLFFRSGPQGRGDGRVLMVDAREDAEHGPSWHLEAARAVRGREEGRMSVLVPLADIAAQDFNLAVDRYVLDPGARQAREVLAAAQARLEDVADLHRPQSLPTGAAGRHRPPAPAASPLPAPGERLIEVGVTDVDEAGVVRRPSKEVAPTPEVVQRSRRARLEAGDVLVVNKGSVGKIAFVRAVPDGEVWLASQSFVVARLRREGPIRDPHVLFRFLSSEVGQAALRSLTVGTTIPGLQMADIRRLPVLVPPLDLQVEVAEEIQRFFDAHDRAVALRDEAGARLSRVWPDDAASRPEAS